VLGKKQECIFLYTVFMVILIIPVKTKEKKPSQSRESVYLKKIQHFSITTLTLPTY